jgi:peptidoglycan hydrolase-like protein with peptidoglycan-binding domain
MANDIVSDESDCTSEEFLLDCARGPCNYDHKKYGHPTLALNASGVQVAHAQCLLRNVQGYNGKRRKPEVAVDGIFGGNTLKAVRDFQRRHGIPDTGNIGAQTWPKLHK